MMKSRIWKQEKRPVLDIPLFPLEKTLEFVAAMGLLASVIIIIKFWPILPHTIPTHFGVSGKPDGWGSKETIFLLPSIGILLIYIPITLLSRYPHIYNYICPITEQNAVEQYYLARLLLRWMKAEIIWLFAGLEWMTVQNALGKTEGLGLLTWMPLVIIFGTIGIYMYKSYQAK